jgi:hypothetical protein
MAALRVVALLAAMLAGCRPGPGPSGAVAPPAASVTLVPSVAEEPSLAGLLIAPDGPLLATDVEGHAGPFDGPPGPVVAVTAAAGRVVAIGGDGQGSWSDPVATGPRAWRPLTPPDAPPGPLLAALSPSGKLVALAIGLPQRPFELSLRAIDGSRTDVIPVATGLNGPPVWVGPDALAVDVVRADQQSGFDLLTIASSRWTALPTIGFSAASDASGRRIAIDRSATGAVLVGTLGDWVAGRFEQMVTIPARPGAGVDALAFNSDGRVLAIARRSDAEVSIEIVAETIGGWRSLRTLTVPTDGAVSIAWLD